MSTYGVFSNRIRKRRRRSQEITRILKYLGLLRFLKPLPNPVEEVPELVREERTGSNIIYQCFNPQQ